MAALGYCGRPVSCRRCRCCWRKDCVAAAEKRRYYAIGAESVRVDRCVVPDKDRFPDVLLT